ncbi:MAG: tyrosine-type recombinase/integrase [Lachnospiraceae bacterium]|nr:tyrosine-type recombinase/integrase [Lachnospiraceae bacterium]
MPQKPEKNTKVLTLDEQRKFLNAAKDSVNYFHFLFILQTGVRSSELRGLRWDDIDFQSRTIHIRRNVTRQYGKKEIKYYLFIAFFWLMR